MKYLALLCLLAAACRNEAITFAKTLNPQASCTAVHTGIETGKYDTAICRLGKMVFACNAFDLECKQLGAPPPEKAP